MRTLIKRDQIKFNYRGTNLPKDLIILSAELLVKNGDKSLINEKIKLIKDEVEIFGDHKNFSSVRYEKDRVKILGKMINLVRKY